MLKAVPLWLSIIGTVSIALLANAVSVMWAKEADKVSLWLFLLLLISPLVFLSFGLVTVRLGVTISSGTIDSLLSVSTIALGLVVFQEWSRISPLQYLGIALAILGIILMVYFPRPGT